VEGQAQRLVDFESGASRRKLDGVFRPQPAVEHTEIVEGVGVGEANHPADVARTKDALTALGLGSFDRTMERSTDATPGFFDAIEASQRRLGVTPDGVMRPGGETNTAFKSAIVRKTTAGSEAARRGEILAAERPEQTRSSAGSEAAVRGEIEAARRSQRSGAHSEAAVRGEIAAAKGQGSEASGAKSEAAVRGEINRSTKDRSTEQDGPGLVERTWDWLEQQGRKMAREAEENQRKEKAYLEARRAHDKATGFTPIIHPLERGAYRAWKSIHVFTALLKSDQYRQLRRFQKAAEAGDRDRAFNEFTRLVKVDPLIGARLGFGFFDRYMKDAKYRLEIDQMYRLRIARSVVTIIKAQRDAEKVPQSFVVTQALKGGTKNFLKGLEADPFSLIANLALENLPAEAAGLVLAAPTGGVSVVANTFASSFAESLVEALVKEGVEVAKPKQLMAAFSNPELMARVRLRAATGAAATAMFDAFSVSLARKLLVPKPVAKHLRPAVQELLNVVVQMGPQGALAALGESTRQWLLFGEVRDWASVLDKGLTESLAGVRRIGPLRLQRLRKALRR